MVSRDAGRTRKPVVKTANGFIMLTGDQLRKQVADSLARRKVDQTPAPDNFTPAPLTASPTNSPMGASQAQNTWNLKQQNIPTEMPPAFTPVIPAPSVPPEQIYGTPAPGQMMQSDVPPPSVVMRGGTTGTDAMSRLRNLAATRTSLQRTKGI